MEDIKIFGTRHNFAKRLNATNIILKSKEVLPEDLVPVSFRAGVLNIEITSQTARHYYEPKKTELIEKINHLIGEDKVKELKLRVTM